MLLAQAAGGKHSPRSISKPPTIRSHCERSRVVHSATGT